MKYKPEYCEKLIEWMSKGYSNLEIAAKLRIAEKTFYDWKTRYPEFGEAYEIGYPLCFQWWMSEGRKKFLENGNDKGYKYWQCCMRNMFGYDLPDKQTTTQTTNNILINNMNVLADKSEKELLEIFQQKTQLITRQFTPAISVDPEENA